MSQDLFVAALQTVSLNKIFDAFAPEKILEITAYGNINENKNIDKNDMLGLEILRLTNNAAKLSYSYKSSARLLEHDIKKIRMMLKNADIDDLIIRNLSLLIELDPKDFKADGDERNYIAEFRNEKCPNLEEIRDNLVVQNEKLYSSPLHKQFRYRQLILNFLIGESQIGTVHRSLQKPIIQLVPKWQKNWEPKYETPTMSSSQTIDVIQDAFGNLCVKENFRLSGNKEWKIVGCKF